MEDILKGLPEPMQLNETILVVAAIFLVLILILNNFIFKPLMAVLDERQKRVKEGAEARDKSLKTVEESMAAYQAALIEARRKAQAKRQVVLKESEKLRGEMIGQAKQEAEKIIRDAQASLDEQVAEAKASLENETRDIADSIVNTVLSRASA